MIFSKTMMLQHPGTYSSIPGQTILGGILKGTLARPEDCVPRWSVGTIYDDAMHFFQPIWHPSFISLHFYQGRISGAISNRFSPTALPLDLKPVLALLAAQPRNPTYDLIAKV